MKLKQVISTVALALGVLLVPFSATASAAGVDVFGGCTGTSASSQVCANSNKNDAATLIGNVVNILIYISGTIAVIVIIVGGIRYVTSGGDSSGITNAKNTILYAVIGLVIVVMAYGIVNFVLGKL